MTNGVLRFAELQMSFAACEAVIELLDAEDAMRAADLELGLPDRASWGGVVDAWHVAFDRLHDAQDALDAFGLFPPSPPSALH